LLLFALTAAFAHSLNAQYVHIANAGNNPNDAMRPPTVLSSTWALYTVDARMHGVEGTVTIAAQVDESGAIKGGQIVKGLGFGLDEVALDSIHHWTLSPATRNGIPVSTVCPFDVQFNLRSAGAVTMAAGMVPPSVLSRVTPLYTDEAKRAQLSGTVVLQAVIRTDGIVDIVRVVRGLAGGLTDSAIDALKQWRFQPGSKNGKAVDVALNIEVNFNLVKNR
jgi:TonB family protein